MALQNISGIPQQMASGGATGQPDYAGYWEVRAQEEQRKKEALLQEQVLETIRKLKIDNDLKESVLDLFKGYGTPFQRQEQLYGGRPGLSEVLKAELAKEGPVRFSNIGEYQVGGVTVPSMRDIAPVREPSLVEGLMRKTLGLSEVRTESSEERERRERRTQEDISKRQEAHDVRMAERYEKGQQRQEESRQAHDSRVGAFNLMEKYNTVVAQANTSYLSGKKEVLRSVADPYYWQSVGINTTNYPKPAELIKAKQDHRRQLEGELEARRTEQIEVANMYKVLASRLSSEVAGGLKVYEEPKAKVGARKIDSLRQYLSEEEYLILTTNYGVTPEIVEKEAAALKVSPEEYIRFLKKALYAQGKKGSK
uniref:Uncharacterized protein n=1 Tax=viral metagenome TaxID=1070528 RepID=A0A6M3XIE4_9ZZZZ